MKRSTHCKKCGVSFEDVPRYGKSAMCYDCGLEDAREIGRGARERNNLLKGQYVIHADTVSHSFVTDDRWNARHKMRIKRMTREAMNAERTLSDKEYK